MITKSFLKLYLVACFFLGSFSLSAQEYTQHYVNGITAFIEGKYSEALEHFELGANKNDKFCCGRLAALYAYGMGVAIDYDKARFWATKGYKLGNSYSTAILGLSYMLEYGMDNENALNTAVPYLISSYNAYDRIYEEGDEMYGNLVGMIAVRYITDNQLEEGERWLERGLADYPTFIPLLGQAAYLYWGVMRDYDKAVKYAIEADKGESLQGTFVLGWCMVHGYGIKTDKTTGFKKIRKVAMIGNMFDAMFALAECYYNGIGTDIDKALAKEWYQKAADAGHPEAQEKINILF